MTEAEFVEQVRLLGINPTEEQLSKLEKLYEIMIEENKVMNLTRIVSKDDVYLKHFYDSLTLTKVCDLTGNLTLCDVGTGAGFPGLVLKIFYPNLDITLVDALQKRVNYLNRVIENLDLNGIEAIHIRAEDLARKGNKYDIVTARAVASLNILSEYCLPFVKLGGYFSPMKSVKTDEEVLAARGAIKLLGGRIEEIKEPNIDNCGERYIILTKKISQTPPKYPRASAQISKKPLS